MEQNGTEIALREFHHGAKHSPAKNSYCDKNTLMEDLVVSSTAVSFVP